MSGSFDIWISGILTVISAKLLPALVLTAAGILIVRAIVKLLGGLLGKTKLEKAAHSLLLSVVRVVLYGLLALMVADKLGIDVSGVIALASVLTLAVSLAVQNALANVLGGFTILYTQPFHSGDVVEIAGQTGVVREIGLAYTKLTTGDSKQISIPNSAVTAAQIINYSAEGIRRVDLAVTASYDSPVQTVLDALKAAAKHPAALEEKEAFAAVERYDDSAIAYTLRLWCKSEDYWTVYYDVNKAIKEEFDRAGVEMTYPHLTVHMEK